MSWNRSIYDNCAATLKTRDSVEPLNHILDPMRFYRCQTCRPELGILGGTNVSHVSGNLIDLENELRGQTLPLTHCPTGKYQGPPEDRFLYRRNCLKPGNPMTKVDTEMDRHLPPCQFFEYKGVPAPPKTKVEPCVTSTSFSDYK